MSHVKALDGVGSPSEYIGAVLVEDSSRPWATVLTMTHPRNLVPNRLRFFGMEELCMA